MKIADIHAHIFPEKLAEKASHSIGSFYGVPIEREADMPRLRCLQLRDECQSGSERQYVSG